MTNKRKAPPPMSFFTVSENTSEQRANKEKEVQNDVADSNRSTSEARENGFTIPNRLPSLNEYINACRANRYVGAKLKKVADTAIMFAIVQALQSGELRRPAFPISITFIWHEKTKRRDADNIASAKKFILDAMQKTEIIPNDSRKYVIGFTDEIVDDTRDFVEVRITEAKPIGGGHD